MECQNVLREQLNLDRAAPLEPAGSNLNEAIEQLQRCCDRGLGAVLAQANAAEQWGHQLDQAMALLEEVGSGLMACLPSDLHQAASLGHLLMLPELLRAVVALDADAISLRSSSRWSTDLKALRWALDGELELKRRELALQQAGLSVVLGHSTKELREAADLLEKQPLLKNLFNQLSGSTGRALKLAREIGANDPEQRPTALRDVAKVVELREAYGPGWQQRMLALELPSERLLPVAEQLQALKLVMGSSAHGPFWSDWLRQAPAPDLQAALSAYEQGLENTVQVLASHGVWPSAVLARNLNSLHESLRQSSQDQSLLADVEPVARWARAAGIDQGATCAR